MKPTAKALFSYRKSCMFLYGMTDAGFDRALGLRIANAKVRSLIPLLRRAAS